MEIWLVPCAQFYPRVLDTPPLGRFLTANITVSQGLAVMAFEQFEQAWCGMAKG